MAMPISLAKVAHKAALEMAMAVVMVVVAEVVVAVDGVHIEGGEAEAKKRMTIL